MLKIEFTTGNAAFCDPYTGEPDERYERGECLVLLKKVCEKIEDGFHSGAILDTNGNKVGAWSLE